MAPTVSFNSVLKRQLEFAKIRMKQRNDKRTAIARMSYNDIATLLEKSEFNGARLRVEKIIDSYAKNELYDILQEHCHTLKDHINSLDLKQSGGKPMDESLERALRSILYAAPHVDIKELGQIRQSLERSLGTKSSLFMGLDEGQKVDKEVTTRIFPEPPSAKLVDEYFSAIAETYDVPYESKFKEPDAADEDQEDDPSDGEGGGQREAPTLAEALGVQDSKPAGDKNEDIGRGSGGDAPSLTEDLSETSPPQDFEGTVPLHITLPSPSAERPTPKLKGAGGVKIKSSPKPAEKKSDSTVSAATPSKPAPAKDIARPEGKIPDVNDLMARFNLLKK